MGGRAVEGARLESVYTSKAYRGFESHPIRQFPCFRAFPNSENCRKTKRFQAASVHPVSKAWGWRQRGDPMNGEP